MDHERIGSLLIRHSEVPTLLPPYYRASLRMPGRASTAARRLLAVERGGAAVEAGQSRGPGSRLAQDDSAGDGVELPWGLHGKWGPPTERGLAAADGFAAAAGTDRFDACMEGGG